jgi:hypothetical protein
VSDRPLCPLVEPALIMGLKTPCVLLVLFAMEANVSIERGLRVLQQTNALSDHLASIRVCATQLRQRLPPEGPPVNWTERIATSQPQSLFCTCAWKR